MGKRTAKTVINMKRKNVWTETTNAANHAGWLCLNPWGEGFLIGISSTYSDSRRSHSPRFLA